MQGIKDAISISEGKRCSKQIGNQESKQKVENFSQSHCSIFFSIIIYNKNHFFSFQDIHKSIISKYFGTKQNSTLTKTTRNHLNFTSSKKKYFQQVKKIKKLHKKQN